MHRRIKQQEGVAMRVARMAVVRLPDEVSHGVGQGCCKVGSNGVCVILCRRWSR